MASRKQDNRLTRRQALIRGAQMTGALAATGTLNAYGLPSLFAPAGKEAPKVTRLGFTTYIWGKDWDIPTLIANCSKLDLLGVELRTQKDDYAHGVEVKIDAARRAEVKKMFEDSPVKLVGLASGCEFHSPDPAVVKENIEAAKAQIQLSHDVGSTGVRVFPNAFNEDVPHEVTITQIAKALDEVGAYAADLGQQVRLECHGSAGNLQTIHDIMVQVKQPSVRVKLNSVKRDTEGEGFEHNFNLVKDFLGDTLHLHDLTKGDFPYQQQMDLLVKMGWTGWQLFEMEQKPPEDRMKALTEQANIWKGMLAKSLAAKEA